MWPDELEIACPPGEAAEDRASPSHQEESSRQIPSPTHGWQMAFPSLSLPTAASWSEGRTARSRRSVDLDLLFLAGILVSETS